MPAALLLAPRQWPSCASRASSARSWRDGVPDGVVTMTIECSKLRMPTSVSQHSHRRQADVAYRREWTLMLVAADVDRSRPDDLDTGRQDYAPLDSSGSTSLG